MSISDLTGNAVRRKMKLSFYNCFTCVKAYEFTDWRNGPNLDLSALSVKSATTKTLRNLNFQSYVTVQHNV
jgi:hypothetical protein